MNTTQLAMIAAVGLLGALVGGAVVATLGEARADEPESVTQDLRLLCRTFQVDLDFGATLETSDRTSEVGQWIGHEQEGGWRLHGLDFEVGQKRTGYPQGYVQVCLER